MGKEKSVLLGHCLTATRPPQSQTQSQANIARPKRPGVPLQDLQAALKEACKRERERAVKKMVEMAVENPKSMAILPPSDSGWVSLKSSGDLVKPPVGSLRKKKTPAGSEARRREEATGSIITTVEGTAFAAAFGSPPISLFPGGRDESLSLELTSATLTPTACSTRPCTMLDIGEMGDPEQHTSVDVANMGETCSTTNGLTFCSATPTTPSFTSPRQGHAADNHFLQIHQCP